MAGADVIWNVFHCLSPRLFQQVAVKVRLIGQADVQLIFVQLIQRPGVDVTGREDAVRHSKRVPFQRFQLSPKVRQAVEDLTIGSFLNLLNPNAFIS